MQSYKELCIEIVVFQQSDDIVTGSPGGIEFGKDSSDNDLGWGE